ncbi:MAG TPA: heme biosynthesis HemY N-terminal domain-containing protein [Hyphomicrobiaceae bacterium]|nr:heme biosynthesis HemY N-terminal domain-containing protein [Hyphomicrobiaceae bacterium]
MIRLVVYLLGIAAAAAGLGWLADRPGTLVLNWEGWTLETSVFRAIVLLSILVGLAILIASIVRQIWMGPAAVGRFMTQRRQERGLDAISSGMIAIGAGDRALATRYAVQARKTLPNEPLTHLLRAQAAQLSGDRATSRRIFEAMLGSPDTEQLGLRGLYLEAEREGEKEAARQFAERAISLNPRLGWPVDALFDLQCRERNWEGALETLAVARKHGHVDKAVADRRRAVLLTALAQKAEDESLPKSLDLALEAHGLAPDLVPAAAIAGRQLAARGSTPKAARVIEKTWKLAPHPDLALVYAFARPGDSPRDRLERLKRLSRSTPHSVEGPIALATAAIEAHDWAEARAALEPLLSDRLTSRVCTLMARIEGGEHNNTGGVREWLARAVNAPRDPAWTADGVVAPRWEPISPVTGMLDAFQWKVPLEIAQETDAALALAKIEEFVALGTGPLETPALSANGSAVIDAGELDEPPAPPSKAPLVAQTKGTDPIAAEPAPSRPFRPSNAPAEPTSPAGRSESSTEVVIAKPEIVSPPVQARVEPARIAESSPTRSGAAAVRPSAPRPHLSYSALPNDPDEDLSPRPAPAAQTPPRQPAPEQAHVERVEPQIVTLAATGAEAAAMARGKSASQRLYVAPRPPDDPGPDAALDDDDTPRRRVNP